MLKVLIVDDHSIVRRGLRDIIEERRIADLAKEAGTTSDALKAAREEKFDIVLLDIDLPDGSGIDIIAPLKEINPDTKVLILSMYSEENYAIRALRSGASGYLNKDCEPSELETAISKIRHGGVFVSEDLSEILVSSIQGSEVPSHQKLSDREFQVMRLMVSGEKLKDIADKLAMSPKTVSTYRSRIMDKLGTKSNAELIRYADHHGLISS